MSLRTRRLRLTFIILGFISLAGCGSFGGGGGGGATDDNTIGAATLSAELSWEDASGPVVAYRVFVSRAGENLQVQEDVPTSTVTILGESGERVSVKVAALDASGNMGPISDFSSEILFTDEGPIVPAAATAGGISTGFAISRSGSTSDPDPQAAAAAQEPSDDTQLDLQQDGASPLLWEADEPSLELRLTSLRNAALRTELAFDRPGEDWWVVGAADFDGDKLTDVLWENGEGVVAFSSLAKLLDTAPVAPIELMGELKADEAVISTGDYDGDGRADLLVEDRATGLRFIWWMGNAGELDVDDLAPDLEESELAASGDFDGDGRGDLLWRAADGALAVHFMAGAVAEARLDLAGGDALEVIASGDFDGDGDDDLVVRNASGVASVLRMHARRAPETWHRAVDTGPGWEVAGVTDVDGDGAADLVWVSEAGSAPDWTIGFHADDVAEHVSIDPGTGWNLVSFLR